MGKKLFIQLSHLPIRLNVSRRFCVVLDATVEAKLQPRTMTIQLVQGQFNLPVNPKLIQNSLFYILQADE